MKKILLALLVFTSTAQSSTLDWGTEKLMLFGGEHNHTYIGCLNCSESDLDSGQNPYGPYGSRYSLTSIWNRYSDFGSHYSIYSACNEYTLYAPVIVDRHGNFYGRLTLNEYRVGNARSLIPWLKAVCRD